MFDQLVGLLLVGLGLQNPVTGIIAGRTIEARQEDRVASREARFEETRQRRMAFQERLVLIGDQRRRGIVEQVDSRMSRINDQRTNQMLKHLTKMSEILEKVIARAKAASEAGKDTSNVDAAVANSQAAIEVARSAVQAQAGKEYVINITDDDGLKNDVGVAMSSLQTDLRTVHQLVVAARNKVSEAIQALAHILGKGGRAPL